MTNTLFGRLLIASIIVLTIFFGAISYIANKLFEENLTADKHEQLKLQNYILLSSAKIREQSIVIEEELRESRFEDFESGLYGYITNQQGDILWRTYSAHSLQVEREILQANNPEIGNAEFIVGDHYYRYHYTVQWEVIDDQPEAITFTVIEDKTPTLQSIREFQYRLNLWMSIVGAVLITLLLALLRWGTLPLRQLAAKLKQVESGDTERLEGQYPRELKRLTRNLNQLLATEKRQRERYHHTLADLAHSLKTPLAVMQTELESGHHKTEVLTEQVERMNEIISHQLQRSVVAEPHKLGEKNSILEAATRLTKALDKVYADKGIHYVLDIDAALYFKGDKRDLTEILGNLLDNASKHCTRTVKVSASLSEGQLLIGVHDDGFGIEDEHKTQLLKRGMRADTRHAGQGLGLDVSRDIVSSYQGELSIADSPLGGALFLVKLPG